MEEPTPRTTLFDLPNDTLCKIAHVSNVSSLASLMCTSSLYKQALLTNDAIWASKLPSHVAVHQYKNAHAALKHWTIATQRLGTSNPHAQWTAPCEKLWPPCDVVILPPPHKEDHPSARPPAILTASCAGTLFFPNATDLSRRYDLPGGRMDHGIQPLLGLHDGRMYLATSHRETIRLWDLSPTRLPPAPPLGWGTFTPGERTANRHELQPIKSLQGHKQGVQSLCQITPNAMGNPSSSILASGSQDSTIRLWSLNALVPDAPRQPPLLATMRGHGGTVMKLFHSKTSGLMSVGSDRQIKGWDLETRRCVSSSTFCGEVLDMRCNDHQNHLEITGNNNTDARLYVLTNMCLHAIDPRIPDATSFRGSRLSKSLLPTLRRPVCMSDIVHYNIAIGSRGNGATVHDIRMTSPTQSSVVQYGVGKQRDQRSVLMHVQHGEHVSHVHLDAHKLVTNTPSRNNRRGVLVHQLHAKADDDPVEQQDKGRVPAGVAETGKEVFSERVVAMACRGSMLALCSSDPWGRGGTCRVGVLEYSAGRLEEEEEEEERGGQFGKDGKTWSRFWRSPSVMSEEEEEEEGSWGVATGGVEQGVQEGLQGEVE